MILRWMIAVFSIFINTSGSSSLGHHYETIEKEKQISSYLIKNEIKRFALTSEKADIPLWIAITPCSSPVFWAVYFANSTSNPENAQLLKEFQSERLETYRISSSKIGQYITKMKTLRDDTHVQIFASAEPEPHASRMAHIPRVRLQPRQKKRRVTVKWDQSPIDPHITEYCLVVSNKRNYTSLCSARGDKYGPYSNGPGTIKGNTSKMGNHGDSRNRSDLLISCVGSRTHHTVDNLEHGKTYFVNLFAINNVNNLTFPYGTKVVHYNKKIKPARLRDGYIKNINLERLDGRAVFRFKTKGQTGDPISVSVIPCGGAVDVEVNLQLKKELKMVANRTRLYSYGHFIIPSAHKGQSYLIKLISTNREELRKTTGVKVQATTKKMYHFPTLPEQMDVMYYQSLTTCNSVTIAWVQSPDPGPVRYCIVAREIRRGESEGRLPNQCQLEERRESADYNIMRCKNIKSPNKREKVMSEKITGLKTDRRYEIQVTVEKSKKRTLSYNLLTVHTTSKCQ